MLRSIRKGLYLGTLVFCACATSGRSTAPAPTAESYAPLTVGSSWTYAMNFPGQKGEMTVALTGEKDGYTVDDRGGSFRHTLEGLRDKQRYLIRHPLKAGTTWKTVVSASAVERSKIESVGLPCQSQAGSFSNCLVVESSVRRDRDMTLHIRWTWAEGIGLVKVETEADLADRGRVPQTEQSLVRYTNPEALSRAAGPSDQGPNTWTH